MREFVNKHPRLYWCVVVSIALIVFAIVTCIGFGKLEKAEAAEDKTILLNGVVTNVKYHSLYEVSSEDLWSGRGLKEYPIFSDFVDMVYEEYPYMIVMGYADMRRFAYYFSKEPITPYYNNNSLKFDILKSDIFILTGYEEGVMRFEFLDCYGKGEDYYITMDFVSHKSTGDTCIVVGSNYDILKDYQGTDAEYFKALVPHSNLIGPQVPLQLAYSASAPYVKFQSLIVENKLNKSHDVTVNEAEHLYSEYFATSNWNFIYDLKNISESDTGYKLNLKFEIELPTLAYVRGLYENLGYNFESSRTILRRNPEAIKYWFKDKNAETRTFVVDYSMEVTPSIYDNVVYQFTYLEWEYLLRALNADLNAELGGYDARERATLLSFMHVKKITTEVITSRDDSEIYGGYTTNVFERGVYDSCVDVYTAVDKNFVTDDLLEDMISDDVKIAEKKYLEELEQRVEDLQNQVDNMTGSLGSFDVEFDGNAFWSAVRSVGAGLLTLSNFLLSLVAIISGFFVFLPFDMQQIIGYLVIVTACVILWKAFKK